ncbi:coat protein [Erysiphe necator associated tombus-like virus 1]|nr:coat protein [Erysiphe necator associated tombus-like virus 1]
MDRKNVRKNDAKGKPPKHNPPTRGRGRRAPRGRRRVPLSSPAKQLRPVQSSVVISGTDIVALLKASKTTKVGSVLFMQPLNPRMLEGTRLALQATAWQNWRPLSLRVRFEGAAPTTVSGQLCAAWAADDREKLPTAQLALLRKMGAMQPNVFMQMWETKTLRVTKPPVQRTLFCDPKREDSRHGVLMAAVTSPPTGFDGTVTITVALDWTIRFESPDIPSQVEDEELAQADEGYYPYFTSASTHLNNSDRICLFSSTTGGYANIARLSSMRTDEVYVPVTADACKYYDSASALKNVGAIVRMKETGDPLVWCFDTKENAAEYVKSGDISKILKWTKDGPWVAGNPLWKPGTVGLEVPAAAFRLHVADAAVGRLMKEGNTMAGETLGRLQEMPLGTVLDPVKVLVEDPVGSSVSVLDDALLTRMERLESMLERLVLATPSLEPTAGPSSRT